jgi:hypothetical protein
MCNIYDRFIYSAVSTSMSQSVTQASVYTYLTLPLPASPTLVFFFLLLSRTQIDGRGTVTICGQNVA